MSITFRNVTLSSPVGIHRTTGHYIFVVLAVRTPNPTSPSPLKKAVIVIPGVQRAG
jgi:hypothetical protein